MTAKETPASIRAWAVATFGKHPRPAVAVRALSEVAELVQACYSWQNAPANDHRAREQYRKQVIKELADVYILAVQLVDDDEVSLEGGNMPQGGSPQRMAIEIAQDMSSFCAFVLADPKTGSWRLQHTFKVMGNLAQKVLEDLQTHVDMKMAVNRGRTWTISETGSVRHV